ncbi:MAG: hypothetical protein ACYDG4_14710 [Desulfuromonadaceae bacterium]
MLDIIDVFFAVVSMKFIQFRVIIQAYGVRNKESIYAMNLTEKEIEVLHHLADAWNSFCELEDIPSRDSDIFMDAINTAQSRISLRVARRVDPGIWRSN